MQSPLSLSGSRRSPWESWRRRRWRDNAWGYLFIAPYLVGLLVFTLGPILGALGLSFANWDLMSPPRLAGGGNYQRLVNDSVFWVSLFNTAYYTFVSVPLGMLVSFGLALLVNQKLRGITFFRTVYFLPGLSSIVAVALMWGWLYDGHAGLINWLLGLIGIRGPLWLGDPLWAMPAVIIMSVWRGVGFDMVIFLAGLQAIPEEYYEAARLDGANRWHLMRFVTLPLLSFTTFFILITSIIWSFRVFDQTYVLTQGGPDYATVTLVYYIYQHAFQRFNMGYAAAIAYILFAITFIVTMVQWFGQRRWVYYE
jgi:multiple sugar transport system permease protein